MGRWTRGWDKGIKAITEWEHAKLSVDMKNKMPNNEITVSKK